MAQMRSKEVRLMLTGLRTRLEQAHPGPNDSKADKADVAMVRTELAKWILELEGELERRSLAGHVDPSLDKKPKPSVASMEFTCVECGDKFISTRAYKSDFRHALPKYCPAHRRRGGFNRGSK